ncbi:MAG: aminopeptidase P family protein [Deltaproteobacteria bacterium]|nr:aminopeptidase P family protein [Deltaproteobacteria bacterium]
MRSERISRVRQGLQDMQLEGVLFVHMPNIRYLTGFTGSEGALLVTGGAVVLLVDGRYTTQAREEVTSCGIREFSDPVAGITDAVRKERLSSLGFEATVLSYDTYRRLAENLNGVRLHPLSGEPAAIRSRKDSGEVTAMKRAAAIAASSLTGIIDMIRPGAVERDIAFALESAMRDEGSEKPAFETIVASGEHAAMPHARPGSRKIEKGDFVVIDYGAVSDGYNSDETCTFMVGEPTTRQRKVYRIVKEAHDRAIEAVKAGASCSEIDGRARSVIEKAGYGGYFSHGTGHGVGLEVHEPPRVSSRSTEVLETGMVVTVEPGIYIPGTFGIRIEDMVLVGESGGEILTKMPKELTVL